MSKLPPPPASIVIPRRHEEHQDMLRSHVAAKQARKELHQRTHGRKFVYPGHLY